MEFDFAFFVKSATKIGIYLINKTGRVLIYLIPELLRRNGKREKKISLLFFVQKYKVGICYYSLSY